MFRKFICLNIWLWREGGKKKSWKLVITGQFPFRFRIQIDTAYMIQEFKLKNLFQPVL